MSDMELLTFAAVQTRLNVEEEQALLRVVREGSTSETGPEVEAFG